MSGDVSGIFGAGTAAIVDNATRLGLTWRLVPGTVTANSFPTNVFVVLDGDTQPSRAQSLIGNIGADQRVMVLIVPPQGCYIIGTTGITLEQSFLTYNVNGSIGADTTTSASYTNLGGAGLTKAFTKKFDETKIRFDFAVTAFTTVNGTVTKFGVQLLGGGGTYDITKFVFNTVHATATGFLLIPDALNGGDGAGTYTFQPLWLRESGTGTMTTDATDWMSYTAQEVW
jgi:hypothetical protein